MLATELQYTLADIGYASAADIATLAGYTCRSIWSTRCLRRPAGCSGACGCFPRGSGSTSCWPSGCSPHLGYARVWSMLTSALPNAPRVSEKALRDVCRRVGTGAVGLLFDTHAVQAADARTPGGRPVSTVAHRRVRRLRVAALPRLRAQPGHARALGDRTRRLPRSPMPATGHLGRDRHPRPTRRSIRAKCHRGDHLRRTTGQRPRRPSSDHRPAVRWHTDHRNPQTGHRTDRALPRTPGDRIRIHRPAPHPAARSGTALDGTVRDRTEEAYGFSSPIGVGSCAKQPQCGGTSHVWGSMRICVPRRSASTSVGAERRSRSGSRCLTATWTPAIRTSPSTRPPSDASCAWCPNGGIGAAPAAAPASGFSAIGCRRSASAPNPVRPH